MIINDMPSGGLNPTGSATQPIYINSNGEAVTTTYALDMVTTSNPGLMSAADKTKLNGVAAGATANIGTITGITMNGSSKGTSGVVDLGAVITAHQSIKTVNGNSLVGSGNVTVSGLPAVTAADNNKTLKVVNGAWQVVYVPVEETKAFAAVNWQGGEADTHYETSITFDTPHATYKVASGKANAMGRNGSSTTATISNSTPFVVSSGSSIMHAYANESQGSTNYTIRLWFYASGATVTMLQDFLRNGSTVRDLWWPTLKCTSFEVVELT